MSDIPPSPVSITAGEPGGTAAIPHDPVQARVIDLLKADPSKSDRSIAEAAGTEHKRVARVRTKLVASGTIAPTGPTPGTPPGCTCTSSFAPSVASDGCGRRSGASAAVALVAAALTELDRRTDGSNP